MALCGDSSLHRTQLHLHSTTKEMRLPTISAVRLLNAEFQQRTPYPPPPSCESDRSLQRVRIPQLRLSTY
jgi:hypothetical protein